MASLRPVWDYPEALRTTVDLLGMSDHPQVVGSFKYEQHQYPSDVDCFDTFTVALPRAEAVKYYMRRLQNIVEILVISPKIIFRDFKAGLDTRYVPASEAEVWTLQQRQAYLETHAFTPAERAELTQSLNNAYDFAQAIRPFYILHWTAFEVLAGIKTVRGRTVTLEQALNIETPIKLDTVTWALDRFVSVEILYDLKYVDQGQTLSLAPLSPQAESLIGDIERYSHPSNYRPLKVLKRLWVLSRIKDCTQILEQINPILGSDTAALNQVTSDIDTILFLLDNSADLDPTAIGMIYTEILSFARRLGTHGGLDEPTLEFLSVTAFQLWRDYRTNRRLHATTIKKWLNGLSDRLGDVIGMTSTQFYDTIVNSGLVCRR